MEEIISLLMINSNHYGDDENANKGNYLGNKTSVQPGFLSEDEVITNEEIIC